MPKIPDRLAPKSDQAAATVVDGEAVIINLGNGLYYSMDKANGLISSMVEQAQSLGASAKPATTRLALVPRARRRLPWCRHPAGARGRAVTWRARPCGR